MLLNFEHVSKSYGERQILDDVTFYLRPGDRLGILGVNGCGKSTLLKVAAGKEEADSGSVSNDPNVCMSYLAQVPDDDPKKTTLEQVLSSCAAEEREIRQYEAEKMLNNLGITDYSQKISELSGGQRKRVALARCLLNPAEVLILDEPTNHLDFAMIRFLEDFLMRFSGAVLFITHDRYFLEHVATQTGELTFGKLYLCEGGYADWLNYKAERAEMAAASERKRQSTLRRELIWVLQGPCARGTKSRERLERYEALKAQLPPQTEGSVSEIRTVTSRLGKTTVELAQVTKSYGGKSVILPFSYILLRDDRLGIIGMNGSGKSTLLNLMSGRIKPDSGNVTVGETVKIGYFTQHSDELNPEMTAIEYVKEHGEKIETLDGYLTAEKLMEMFLFPGPLQYRKIGKLSGGEKRRLFLLGILASSPNILLLDEPTNDLDIPTMQILENYLETFPAAIVAVSHDRYFLDRICRHVFVMRPGEIPLHCNGGFTDYTELSKDTEKTADKKKKEKENAQELRGHLQQPKKLKFSFNEQREYETIDDDIASLEQQLNDLSAEEENFSADYMKLQELYEKREQLEKLLEDKMDRWVYLNDLAEQIEKQKKQF